MTTTMTMIAKMSDRVSQIDIKRHSRGRFSASSRRKLMEWQMRANLRRRFWVESGLAVATGILALITPVFPDWIEFLSGWDPDQHDGSVEWLVVVGLFVATLAMFTLAAMEWRRTPVAAST